MFFKIMIFFHLLIFHKFTVLGKKPLTSLKFKNSPNVYEFTLIKGEGGYNIVITFKILQKQQSWTKM